MNETVIFITARRGYITDGLNASGFLTFYPYKDKTILGRVLREVWFQVGLPEQVWYNNSIDNAHIFIIHDPQITKRYLVWFKNKFKDSEVNFVYGNIVGKARHVYPKQIPDGIQIWTFDKNDSDKYKIRMHSSGGYLTSYIKTRKKVKYDVFYIGADKGRAQYIINLQKQMESIGIITKFLITANGKFSSKKTYYAEPISYDSVIDYVSESKAILNIMLPNQNGATMRDYESIFIGVKLITNNKNIKNYDFYIENNVFILGERDISELKDFLSTPFIQINKEILRKHTIYAFVKEIVSSK